MSGVVAASSASAPVATTTFPGTRAAVAAAVADAVDAVGGVTRTNGAAVEIATQYAGGAIRGVKLTDDEVALHLVASRMPLPALIDEVRRAALRALAVFNDPRPVAITIEDIDLESLPGGQS